MKPKAKSSVVVSSKPGRLLSVPRAVRREAEQLSELRGVVGVFWGSPRRDGLWADERCLVVHVRRKQPLVQLGDDAIPKRVVGALAAPYG